MKATPFLLILLILPISYAQSQGIHKDLESIAKSFHMVYLDLDSLSEAQADSLIADKGVEHVIIFESGCIGCVPLKDWACRCEDSDTDTRLIWKEGQNYYMKRIRCCVNDKVEEFSNVALFEGLINNRNEILSSTFKSNIEEVHYFFKNLNFITSEGKQEVSMKSFFFNEDNKYRQYNLKQAAKIHYDMISAELYKN